MSLHYLVKYKRSQLISDAFNTNISPFSMFTKKYRLTILLYLYSEISLNARNVPCGAKTCTETSANGCGSYIWQN